MMKKVISILLIVFSCAACHADVKAEAVNKTIIIPHNPYSLTPVLNVYINDQGPFNFVIDTGATQSSISRQLADDIGLSYQKQNSVSILKATKIDYPDVTEVLNLFISDDKIQRRTNLYISDHKFNNITKVQGILGTAQLYGATLKNNPQKRQLELKLPSHIPACDLLSETSYCHNNNDSLSQIDFSIGTKTGQLILDTGYQGYKAIALFKTTFTNDIWAEHHLNMTESSLKALSDKAVKFFRTKDFSINGNRCFGEFLIRNPKDQSPLFTPKSQIAVLGWSVLQNIDFHIDYKTNETAFNLKTCPYRKIKTIGINGIYTSDDFKYMYIEDIKQGSPADRAGVKLHDQVEKIILSTGQSITNFDSRLYDHNDDHVYAAPGQTVSYFIRRDDQLIRFDITAEAPALIDLQ